MTLRNATMINGYTPDYFTVQQLINETRFSQFNNLGVQTKRPVAVKRYYTLERIWVPPTSGYPGSPAIPPTPTVALVSKNKGWNSWARSVNPLVRKQAIKYSLSLNNEGCFLGIGVLNKEGHSTAAFSHAIVSDLSGLYILENGVKVKQLKGIQTSINQLHIYRSAGDIITYTAVINNETVAYKSSLKYVKEQAYAYAYLYSAGDQILNTEFITGRAQYGSV